MGNPGWWYHEVLPLFKKHEDNAQIANEYHGKGGELTVSFADRFATDYAAPFVEACLQCGFTANADYNGARQDGAGLFQFTIKNGRRHSAAAAFLKPVLKRPNLTVITHAHAQQLLLKNDRAYGVEVRLKDGAPQTFFAARELILCAGAFASPQLLMLSGIGHPHELKKHGIEVKRNLSGVGKNLQDHLFFPVSASATGKGGQNHHIAPLQQIADLLQYALYKKGAMTIGPLEAVAFGSTAASPLRVDYQFQFAAFQVGNNYQWDLYNLSTFPTREDGFTILPTLLRPQSRGYLQLKSSNPYEPPLIQPNFLSHEADCKVLIDAGKKAVEVLQAPAFDTCRKQMLLPPDSSSDEAWLHHIQRSLETVYHPVGTCKMGTDEMAVVNPQLQVHGLEGLRVADASIMPAIVSGNTNAPVYMIAEMAANLILKS
jgi:choline dehydrogenase